MQFWQAIARTEVDQLVPLARLVEDLGFAGVTMSDHVVRPREVASRYPYSASGKMATDESTPYLDPWVLVGALSRATQTLRFMSYVYIPALRDPFSVAKSVATAAVVSGERVLLGVGVGWMAEEFALVEREFDSRGPRTDELLEVMRQLMSGDMVEFHGEFYDFPPVQMSPVPTLCPPILAGGHSAPALRRAAASDGWLGVNYDLETVLPILSTIRSLRKEAGRDELSFDVAIALNDSPEQADLDRLEEAGVTMIVNPPLLRVDGGMSSFEEKRDVLEAYAARFIG